MHFLLTLLLQIAVILVAARLVGFAFRMLSQPQVVGEMAAGILLGPSLLGVLAPELSQALFPPASLVYLDTVSQIGLLLFMFLVGLEFDPKLMRGRGHVAVVTSHVSITAPFFLGSVLALHLYPRLSDASVSFDGFALFMGAAMSVTAFPVLARILVERNMLRTRVGAVTIACAAVDDVTAWMILAVVIAIVRAHALETPLWVTLVGTALYVAFMLLVVRRGLALLERRYHGRGRVSQDMLAVVLLLLLASAWTTEWLGIHALFGAFVLGFVMPKDRGLVHEVTHKLEDVTVVLLLPLFFASAGLRTRIGLVSGPEMWGFFGLIMLVAVVGKFGGSSLAARATGLSWREASALGVLMNTRGLMELVILTIGLQLGVISPALFAMMVMMALLTTAMTTPLLQWLYPTHVQHAAEAEQGQVGDFVALLPVALPSSGPGLLRVAEALTPSGRARRIYGMHLQPSSNQIVTDLGEPELPADDPALQPMLQAARGRDLALRPLAFVSHDPSKDIVDVARIKGAELVVLGWHKPIVSQRLLGGVVSHVLAHAPAQVAVYIERHFEGWRRLLVPYRDDARDAVALAAAGRIAARGDVEITVLHITPEVGAASSLQLPEPLLASDRIRVATVTTNDHVASVVEAARDGYDLLLIAMPTAWKVGPAAFGPGHQRLVRETQASLLLLRDKPS